MKNVLLTIAYDGTNFSGWQRQPGQRTVQGEVERVLSVLCSQNIQINGTSRTDAGVHALGQRASFRGEFGIPVERIPQAANNLLASGMGRSGTGRSGTGRSGTGRSGTGQSGTGRSGTGRSETGDVRILSAEEVDLDFHARFSSRGKRYVYHIRNSSRPDLFKRNYCYQIQQPLDEEAMAEAAAYIVGEHDFRCFMAAGGQEMESTVRQIYELEVKREHSDIYLSVAGSGFLYNMVRIITGTLVEVGLGKRRPEDLKRMIESRDRREAGHTAPPQGLYLLEVFYENQRDL